MRKYEEVQEDRNNQSQQQILALLQAELKKDNFCAFDKLDLAFREQDIGQTGHLSKSDVRRILISSLGLSRSHIRSQSFRHVLDSYLNLFQASIN